MLAVPVAFEREIAERVLKGLVAWKKLGMLRPRNRIWFVHTDRRSYDGVRRTETGYASMTLDRVEEWVTPPPAHRSRARR